MKPMSRDNVGPVGMLGAAHPARPAGSIWIMGLSSAGKSTLANLLVARLRQSGYPCLLLDGDQIRQVFDERLGYDRAARRKQTSRVLRLARLVAGQGILPVVAIIHPVEEDRRMCREAMPGYFEVWLKCTLDVCVARDTKNVYRPALDGKAANVVGLDIPYEEPRHADLTLDSGLTTPDQMLDRLWSAVETPLLAEGPWGTRARAALRAVNG
jgi:adenylyl-sulfate kinase